MLERGGASRGSSAGATIQGDYLVRGDRRGTDVMMTEEPDHQQGFAFLRHVAIDQHINTRNRWNDLIPSSRTIRISRHRALRRHGHRRHGRHVRSHGQVEGGRPRQHAPRISHGRSRTSCSRRAMSTT